MSGVRKSVKINTVKYLYRTYSCTVLKGIFFGAYPVVSHLTFTRVLPKGVQVHSFGQILAHAPTSHRAKMTNFRVVIRITLELTVFFSEINKKKY